MTKFSVRDDCMGRRGMQPSNVRERLSSLLDSMPCSESESIIIDAIKRLEVLESMLTPKDSYDEIQLMKFWRRIQINEENECWPWTGPLSTNSKGKDPRGNVYFNGTTRLVHRLSAIIVHGPPENDEMVCMHICDNSICCNPSHLKWGTQKENVHDMIAKGRARGPLVDNPKKTHCAKGHEYSKENTYRMPGSNLRVCKKCHERNRTNRRNRLRAEGKKVA